MQENNGFADGLPEFSILSCGQHVMSSLVLPLSHPRIRLRARGFQIRCFLKYAMRIKNYADYFPHIVLPPTYWGTFPLFIFVKDAVFCPSLSFTTSALSFHHCLSIDWPCLRLECTTPCEATIPRRDVTRYRSLSSHDLMLGR